MSCSDAFESRSVMSWESYQLDPVRDGRQIANISLLEGSDLSEHWHPHEAGENHRKVRYVLILVVWGPHIAQEVQVYQVLGQHRS